MAKKKVKQSYENGLDKIDDTMKAHYKLMSLDTEDPNYYADLKEFANDYIKTRNVSKKIKKISNFDEQESFKIKPCYNERRLAAIMEYIPYFAKKFKNKYQNAYIENTMFAMLDYPSSCLPDMLFDIDNEAICSFDVILAIALYMLDELYYNGNLHTAMLYIPSDISYDEPIFEHFNDPLFSNDMISGLIYLIENRNDNENSCFLNKTTVKITEETAENINHTAVQDTDIDLKKLGYDEYCRKISDKAQNMSCKERLTKIFELMSKNSIDEAKSAFCEELERYLDMIFKTCDNIYDEYREKIKRAIEMNGLIKNLANDYYKTNEKVERIRRQNIKSQQKPSMTSLINMPDANSLVKNTDLEKAITSSMSVYSAVSSPMTDELKKLYKIAKEREALINEAGSISKAMSKQDFNLQRFISYAINPHENSDDALTDEIYDDFKNFHVTNPFEIFFGYFCLIESGSNLPWLVEISAALLGVAAKQLPWTKRYDKNLREQAVEQTLQKKNKIADLGLQDYFAGLRKEYGGYSQIVIDRMFTSKLKKRNCDKENSMMYNPIYTNACEWKIYHYKKPETASYQSLNYSQILYNMTGTTNLRNLNYDKNMKKGFAESGIKLKNADMTSFLIATCDSFSEKISLPSIEDAANDEIIEQSDDLDTLKQELLDSKTKITELKQSVYETERKNRKLTEEMDKLIAETNDEHHELAMLREIIYKLQNNESENETHTKITFPYETKQNVVIFGGHETWLKAIEPLLPNVRIIDPYTNPDTNIIRNADIVWLQSNAMPHSRFNKIINITRCHKIPVEYFAYASAEKCAEQLAENDSETSSASDEQD